MTRRRRLRPEEVQLWDDVAKTAIPLRQRIPAPSPPASPKPTEFGIREPALPQDPGIAAFRIGEAAVSVSLGHRIDQTISAQITSDPIVMDAKAFSQLKRGKLKPEARIDLHGMTLARAHPALTGFIQRAAARKLRLVLVITGKGKSKDDGGPIPQRTGVLRHHVPHWLQTPPLNLLVMQIRAAHLRHGGGGAYYVYLRRRR